MTRKQVALASVVLGAIVVGIACRVALRFVEEGE